MSYRTYVNDTQIFGNNVIYPKWQNAYFYMPYSFYMACRDSLEPAQSPVAGRLDAYVLKPGKRIYVRAD